jgi:hypothetical protein
VVKVGSDFLLFRNSTFSARSGVFVTSRKSLSNLEFDEGVEDTCFINDSIVVSVLHAVAGKGQRARQLIQIIYRVVSTTNSSCWIKSSDS